MVIIGIDPDSEKHGVAIYIEGKLDRLDMLSRKRIITYVTGMSMFPLVLSIENNLANDRIYARNENKKRGVEREIARKIGRVQQAQVELMRDLDEIHAPYMLHKPNAANWKDKTETFKRITGWEGRSNGDTRSAAYFGWLQLKTMGA